MLGKGLESLIPPQKGSGGASGNDLPTHVPIAPQQAAEKSATPEPLFMDIGLSLTADEGKVDATPYPEEQRESSRAEDEAFTNPHRDFHEADFREEKKAGGHKKQLGESVFYLEVEKIKSNPQQPRRNFDEAAIRELAASIREFGILQPLVVSKIVKEVPTGTEVEYQLIAGERRLLASKMLGLERVPAVVRNIDFDRERLELAVIENLQRENLNPIEMGRAFSRLQDEFRMTQREIALRLGKSREVVANTLRLLDLPTEIQEALEKNLLTESHGRLLLTVTDPALQQKIFKDLMEHRMTTRELKERVGHTAPVAKKEIRLSPELKALAEKLSSELGTPVKIEEHGAGGKITITFYSEEELNAILHRFMKETGEMI